MLTLSITIEGVEEARFSLLRFSQQATDLRVPLSEIDTEIRGMFNRQFESEGAYRSEGWAPLAKSTIARRRRRHNANGRAHPRKVFSPLVEDSILIDTGRLFRSAVGTGSRRDTVRQITAGSLVSGTRVPYGIYHQSKAPRKHLPRRPLIEINDDDSLMFARRIQAHIVATQRRAALLGHI